MIALFFIFYPISSTAFESNLSNKVPAHFRANEEPYRVEEDDHPAHEFRKRAGENLKKQLEKMIKQSKKKLKPASVGDHVAVFSSEFDRGRGDPANVIGVITHIDENEKYTVATSVGKIKNKLERNCFDVVKYKGLDVTNVPDVQLTMREIITLQSVGHGQGFRRCSCKIKCDSARCTCRKNKLACNSACHKNNSSCANHD